MGDEAAINQDSVGINQEISREVSDESTLLVRKI
jgi:hypothetical protein